MLANFWKIKEVRELRNREAVNELLGAYSEDWRLIDCFINCDDVWYVLARYED